MIGGRWQLLIPVKLGLIGTVQNYENQGSCWERISQRAPCSSDFKDVCQNVINRAADKNVESLKQGTGIMYSKLKAVVRQALLLTSLVIEAMIVVRCVLLGEKKKGIWFQGATQLIAQLKPPHFSCKNIYEIMLENVTVHHRSIYHSDWLGGKGLKKYEIDRTNFFLVSMPEIQIASIKRQIGGDR